MHVVKHGLRKQFSDNGTRLSCVAARLLFFACLLLFVPACSSLGFGKPTLVPLAPTPVIENMEARMVAAEAQSTRARPTPLGTRIRPTSTPTPTATPTWIAPPPDTAGIRPSQARLYRMPSIGPEATVEWRPPPYSVPLSLHPNDHYWLSRPLPSDSRNYDLWYYPFGNNVLIPEIDPIRIHHGLDYPNPVGTPILAAGSGIVVHAGVKRNPIDGVTYYGNTVIVKHDWQWRGQDVYTLYAHTLELFVEVGDYVEQGQLLAGVGQSGVVTGPHLHFEVRIGENLYRNAVNPMLWVAPYEGWGTLAGRVVDKHGKFITGAYVSVRPLDRPGGEVERRTYLTWDIRSDDVWQENFVIGDLPAGRYLVTVKAGQVYEYIVDVLPGQTNFLVVQTGWTFKPAPPTPTPTGTVEAAPIE